MTTVTVDLSDAEKLLTELETFAHKAVPYATRNALNAAAFAGRKLWVTELGKAFTLRNTYTARSLRIEKATGLDVDTMQSVLGSPLDYLALEESGGVERGKSGALPMPSAVAAGQPQGTRPRTKAIRRPNWLPHIKLAHRQRSGNAKQRNAIAISMASRAGQRFVYLELPRVKGIFELKGRLRQHRGAGRKRSLSVRLIWSLSKAAAHVKPHPTLQNTIEHLMPRMPELVTNAVVDQLRHNRVLGY